MLKKTTTVFTVMKTLSFAHNVSLCSGVNLRQKQLSVLLIAQTIQ